MQFLHDEGIVLRKRPLKEKDEMITVLTRFHGKKTFVVPGSRDPRSKKAGLLELSNTIAFQVPESSGKMSYLNQVKLVTSRGFHIVEDDHSLEDFYRALRILKLTDQFVQEDQNVHRMYEVVSVALDAVREPLSMIWFWVQALDELGLSPEFKSCVFCQRKHDSIENISFCSQHRGFAHTKCLSMNTESDQKDGVSRRANSGKNVFVTVHFDMVKVMSYLQAHPWSEVSKLNVSAEMLKSLVHILETVGLD